MNQHRPLFAITFSLLLGCGGMTDGGESPHPGSGGTDYGKGGAMTTGGGAAGTAGAAGPAGTAGAGAVGTGGAGVAGGARTATGGAGGRVVGAAGTASSGVGGAKKANGAGGYTVGSAGTKDAGVGAGGSGSRDASSDGAKPPPDAGSSVECVVNEDCLWGEIHREIVVATDCMCLYGCPWVAMNRTTATRREAQYAALCDPDHDGRGQPCGIDDCAIPPSIVCDNHECKAIPKRAGQACSAVDDCDTGFTCVSRAPGGYCVPGAANTPTDCGDGGSCPSGTACSPLPWDSPHLCLQTCSTNADCRSNYRCDYVGHYPGDRDRDKSLEKVCWTACTPGVIPSCNPDPIIESVHGTCSDDGTCQCSSPYTVDSATGRCN